MNHEIRNIVNSIIDISTNWRSDTINYKALINILSSVSHKDDVDTKSVLDLRDELGTLNLKLHAKYDDACNLFDTANPLECFQPKYSISRIPIYSDYAELLVSLLGMEYVLLLGETLGVTCYNQSIKRDLVSVLGRFLFLYNGNIQRNYKDSFDHPDIFDSIFIHAIRIIVSLKWSHEEYPQLRLILLNLFDALSLAEQHDVYSLIEQSVSEENTGNLIISGETLNVIRETLDRYYAFLGKENIVEIQTNWLYAYIYKKRFGFIFCKKFTKTCSTASLPLKFIAYSPAFKNGASLQVANGPKVVLFEAGENKRSSEYVPLQSSAFYNIASGMFE